jgi:hypothetical protein
VPDHWVSGSWDRAARQRKDAHRPPTHCSAGLESIEEALRPGPLLQVASVCETPAYSTIKSAGSTT